MSAITTEQVAAIIAQVVSELEREDGEGCIDAAVEPDLYPGRYSTPYGITFDLGPALSRDTWERLLNLRDQLCEP